MVNVGADAVHQRRRGEPVDDRRSGEISRPSAQRTGSEDLPPARSFDERRWLTKSHSVTGVAAPRVLSVRMTQRRSTNNFVVDAGDSIMIKTGEASITMQTRWHDHY